MMWAAAGLAAVQQVAAGLDWSAINTALTIGAILYLYRQARVVDAVRQLLLGAGGEDTGIVGEIKLVRERTHELASTITMLNGSVEHLVNRLDRLEQRDTEALRLERRNAQREG